MFFASGGQGVGRACEARKDVQAGSLESEGFWVRSLEIIPICLLKDSEQHRDMVFKAVHQVGFGSTTDGSCLRQFRTIHPLEPFVNGELYRECRKETPVGGAKTFRKVILAGGVAWLDPNIIERTAYYNRFPRVRTSDKDLGREAHRHSYMVTKALIEDCIPPRVLAEMVHQGYPWAGWDGHYTDLCSLIMVVQDLMMSVIKSQTLVNYDNLHVGNEDGKKCSRW